MPSQKKIRRAQAREHRFRITGTYWSRAFSAVFNWPVLLGLAFAGMACAITLINENGLDYIVGQRITQPLFARVDFQIKDQTRTAADKEAARASVPSYFTRNAKELTVARIRAELMRVYGTAADAANYDEYKKAIAQLGWPDDENAYRAMRSYVEMRPEIGRESFERIVDLLPIEDELVVRDLGRETRTPPSARDVIILEETQYDGQIARQTINQSNLISQGNEKALRGSVVGLARKGPFELRNLIEAIVLAAFKDQPTIIYNQKRTLDAMAEAEQNTPEAYTAFVKGKPFINPGVLNADDYALMELERKAYQDFLTQSSPEAQVARRNQYLRLTGLAILIALLSAGLFAYTKAFQPDIFESRPHSVVFCLLILGAMSMARVLDAYWPQIPELIYTPFLLVTAIFAIVHKQRFAMGVSCINAILASVTVQGDLSFLMPLLIAATVVVQQLDEVRARTKLIRVGLISSAVIMFASIAVGIKDGNPWTTVWNHALWAGACAMLAAFLISGLLPFVEKLFRTATALTLLEWRDPTRPLLQLLAREAPGTYAHSLVLGTLAEAACEKIGANALLAQVGALYHDIGKIPKAQYFTENQDGHINRHENLAPTMSLLIILGHVKDGLELAREFKLPRALHPFIEEHHGTTVVRYFHHAASEKQAQIATGKHDREVPEAEFRYSGPTPRTRETAVLMLCDSVEGAVRALAEPTAGRIEAVVHQIITDRLNDGQFDECDITLREIRSVEESLVKSLIGIYHGRVAYPRVKPIDEDETSLESTASTTAVG